MGFCDVAANVWCRWRGQVGWIVYSGVVVQLQGGKKGDFHQISHNSKVVLRSKKMENSDRTEYRLAVATHCQCSLRDFVPRGQQRQVKQRLILRTSLRRDVLQKSLILQSLVFSLRLLLLLLLILYLHRLFALVFPQTSNGARITGKLVLFFSRKILC